MEVKKGRPASTKFRDYRIIEGERKPMKNKWIEKSTHLLDTPQERRKISVARRIAQLKPKKKKRKKPVKRKPAGRKRPGKKRKSRKTNPFGI